MEWVEVTGKTVEDAKDEALDQLGVDESDAEFEILEEPKAGLFGLLRSQARVRARVLPAAVRPKIERRERRRPGRSGGAGGGGRRGGDSGGGDGASAAPAAGAAAEAGGAATAPRGTSERRGGRAERGGRPQPGRDADTTGSARRRAPSTGLEEGAGMGDAADGADAAEVAEVAEEFLAGLLAAFGTRFQLERRVLDDDTVEIAVTGDDLGLLIGPRGQTLAAVQELTRTVVQRRIVGPSPRLLLDVAGYRQARREALERFTRSVADQVRSSGTAMALEPMPAPDRKVVHDTINTLDGVSTTSEGEEPNRRVVILPQE